MLKSFDESLQLTERHGGEVSEKKFHTNRHNHIAFDEGTQARDKDVLDQVYSPVSWYIGLVH